MVHSSVIAACTAQFNQVSVFIIFVSIEKTLKQNYTKSATSLRDSNGVLIKEQVIPILVKAKNFSVN